MSGDSTTQPLVVVLCAVPLVCEAIASALDSIAEVRSFPARRRDAAGLLASVRPDAVVVDDPIEAAEARSWAESQGIPLVHICLRQRKLRVLRNGEWEESVGASAESIRNAIAGLMFARSGVVR